jgi:putative tryptophan/tyrosine transport system substrate-binding protein
LGRAGAEGQLRPSVFAWAVTGLALVLLAAPFTTVAQPSGKVFQIGILSNVPLTSREGAPVWGAFIQGLRELGYVEGQNITIVHRSSEGRYQRLPDLAAELVRLKVDVIVAPASQNVRAAMQATRTIPIVMTGTGDPVAAGLVASLAHPGGNVTGLSLVIPDIVGKQLALLKEAMPRVSRVAVLANPTNEMYTTRWLSEAKTAARSLGLQLEVFEARVPDDFSRASAALSRIRAEALFVQIDGMFLQHPTKVVDLAVRHRLPAMYGAKEFVDAGGLMFYGPSMRDGFRRAATYVDKILKGAKPSELPVEQPTKFELVINGKTARALGITIPQSLVSRADDIVQ